MNIRKHRGRKLVSLILVVLILQLSFPVTAEVLNQSNLDLNYFLYIKSLIENNYFYDLTESELMEGAIKGLFQALDENSQYYTKEEYEKLVEDLSGDFVGIGVYIKEDKGSIIITESIKGSPAEKAGLKPQDEIISVDGKSVKGKSLEEVTRLIKGAPGTTVKIGINRNNRKIYKNIKRAEITINPVEYQILKDNIGYLKISQFNPHTYESVLSALKEFDKKKISNIIIDLRNNPGGMLGEVVNVLNLFIPEGPIVHVKYKNNVEQTYYSKLKKAKYKLAVLVNENSASASEIFAGAVKDREVGKIIGTKTYGKGTVQQIIPLPYGDGIKLTIAEYQTPNRKTINQKGIQPDIVVRNPNQQLQKAIEILSQ